MIPMWYLLRHNTAIEASSLAAYTKKLSMYFLVPTLFLISPLFLTACTSSNQTDIDFTTPARQSLLYCDGVLFAGGEQVTKDILDECIYIGTVTSSVTQDEIPHEHLQDNGYCAGAEVYRRSDDSIVIFHNNQYWTYYKASNYQ